MIGISTQRESLKIAFLCHFCVCVLSSLPCMEHCLSHHYFLAVVCITTTNTSTHMARWVWPWGGFHTCPPSTWLIQKSATSSLPTIVNGTTDQCKEELHIGLNRQKVYEKNYREGMHGSPLHFDFYNFTKQKNESNLLKFHHWRHTSEVFTRFASLASSPPSDCD